MLKPPKYNEIKYVNDKIGKQFVNPTGYFFF